MSNEIKAFIFDIGNVVFDISFDLCYEKWASITKCSKESIISSFAFDEVHKEFERGNISENEYASHVGSILKVPFSTEEFKAGWNNIFLETMPDFHLFMKQIHKDFRLVTLSNTNITHVSFFKEPYKKEMKYFEKVFCSNEIGAIKPDAESYKIILNHLNLSPEECVFIDDKAINIEGAKKLGINAFQFTSYQALVKDLHQELNLSIELKS